MTEDDRNSVTFSTKDPSATKMVAPTLVVVGRSE